MDSSTSKLNAAMPELANMMKYKLFDEKETRKISKARENFHDSILKLKTKDAYGKWIQYELALLSKIEEKRKEKGITEFKNKIEFYITDRLNELFNDAVVLFPDDVKLWIAYINFCHKMHNPFTNKKVQRLLEVHKDKPYVWKFVANWEFQINRSIENARLVLIKGTQIHQNSELLFSEAFKLELEYMKLKLKEHANSEACAGRNPDITSAILMYATGVMHIPNISFYLRCLTIAKKYDFAVELQQKIVTDLKSQFSDKEQTWDTIARLQLEGYPLPCDLLPLEQESQSFEEGENEETVAKNSLKQRILKCCAVYKKGTEIQNTIEMWNCYIEAMLEVYRDHSSLPIFKLNKLREALSAAHTAEKLSEKYYVLWIEITQDDKRRKLNSILSIATQRYPQSIELWTSRLRYHLMKDEEQVALKIFKEARLKLGDDNMNALPLWKLFIHYYQTECPKNVEQMFKEAIMSELAVAVELKPLFIEWIVLAKGIFGARRVYQDIQSLPPLCLELHQKMISLEFLQPNIKLQKIRQCYSNACAQFGKDNPVLWIDYIKFEQKYGTQESVAKIYWGANGVLEGQSLGMFVNMCNLSP